MPSGVEYRRVEDNVPKVDGKIAVGEDLKFQRRWWRFETVIWTLFVLIIVADLSGILGRGPLANARRHAQDGSLDMRFERVERANTSSIMTLQFGATAVHDGKTQLFVSNSILSKLGAQRVIPQPEISAVGDGGVTYTFSATALPMMVQIELKPSFVGPHEFTVGVPGGIFCMPRPSYCRRSRL